MTTRVFTSPLFLGFDHLEQMLERAAKNSDGYPPYNIEQIGPTGLRITLAVAGFTMDDLQITQEDNQLVIRGRQADDGQGVRVGRQGMIRCGAERLARVVTVHAAQFQPVPERIEESDRAALLAALERIVQPDPRKQLTW